MWILIEQWQFEETDTSPMHTNADQYEAFLPKTTRDDNVKTPHGSIWGPRPKPWTHAAPSSALSAARRVGVLPECEGRPTERQVKHVKPICPRMSNTLTDRGGWKKNRREPRTALFSSSKQRASDSSHSFLCTETDKLANVSGHERRGNELTSEHN